MEFKNYEQKISVRLFDKEKLRMHNIVLNAEDEFGGRKYESTSHFCRCAILRLISLEEKNEEDF